jgi:hypothetical protein
METLYVYLEDDKPVMLDGYYLTSYHKCPVKIGDTAKLVFLKGSGPPTRHNTRYNESNKIEIVRVTSIRFQYWNGDNDHNTNPALDKYILRETIPGYKNWVEVEFISEIRDDKLNQLGI